MYFTRVLPGPLQVINSPAGNLRLILSASGDIYTYAEPRAYVEDSKYIYT